MSPTSASSWTREKVEQTWRTVIGRAARDAAFRRRCLEDPSSAIREASGLELPAGAPRVRFVERRDEIVVLLPPFTGPGPELADEDLALISGGMKRKQEEIQELQAQLEEINSDDGWSKPT